METEGRYDFDEVTLLTVFAMGVPGKRTFFLAIGQKAKWVRIWLEKYLLETLASAIEQFLINVAEEEPALKKGTERTPISHKTPAGLPLAELDIDQISLGFDKGRGTLNIMVHKIGPLRADSFELNYHITLSQLETLGNEARNLCSAGRPICSICGNPIDPGGHVCPGTN